MGVGNVGEAGGMALHTKMLLGFAVGAVAGGLAFSFGQAVDPEGVQQTLPWLAATLKWVTQPVGSIFLNLLFMLVLPLVFSALVLGVVEIGDPKALGRIGGKTLAFILVVTGIAVTIGLVAVNLFQPGVGIDPAVAQKLIAESSSQAEGIVERGEAASAMQVLLSIVPRNPLQAGVEGNLIGVMFFALLFGIGAATLKTEGVRTFVGTLQGVYDITLLLINKVIQLAPYAVAALIFNLIAVKGFAALLPLAKFVAVAVGALAVHMFVVFPLLLWFIGRMNPIEFFKKAEPVILTAFSTSSSSATLPTTLRVAEEVLGTPKRIGRFVCTLGATANMNGTALFEGVVVLFLAQFFGIELSFAQQVLVLLMCILGGIGAAGVPGGSLPVIASILVMFGIPPEGIALILGVDRFIDMCRTAVNVTGDLVGTVVVSRGEPPDPVHDEAAKPA
ncbi:dicarboxylate/amino acid:cation symporter [Silanimonas sp.]|jgi:DAACS family dicarboxylate/amino acid:cation (Na+ or H+) symporter|uniref:dicarboxylate/amino acid:cation symporter n=1 Tax=Silanimonas sp. TaxID=1929290 RepID=UPI0022C6B433|nr:dicarboxylate/amino acid:cation symporter [Silanimonas sp.]MCZ8064100.1 dicarboxylate/amino acid:cation symporter [Silanimonas sp.]